MFIEVVKNSQGDGASFLTLSLILSAKLDENKTIELVSQTNTGCARFSAFLRGDHIAGRLYMNCGGQLYGLELVEGSHGRSADTSQNLCYRILDTLPVQPLLSCEQQKDGLIEWVGLINGFFESTITANREDQLY